VSNVRHHYDAGAMKRILASPSGGLAKDLVKRAIRVQTAAKRNLQRPPQRVNTGLLRASITWQLLQLHGYPAVRIGTNVKYARYVHDGTGLYGPKHSYITPKRGKYLVFKLAGEPGMIFAKRVKGMRPNPFLKDAMPAAKL
jgi:hypothetical protein